MTYLTAQQAATKWDVSAVRVKQWAQEGRIKGAMKIGDQQNAPWLIPAKARKPKPRKPGRKSE